MRSFGLRVWAGAACAALVAGAPSVARADGAATGHGVGSLVETKGGGGFLVETITADAIVGVSCVKAKDCAPEGGTQFRPPEAVRTHLDAADARIIKTSRGKEMIETRVPAGGDRSWVLLLAPSGDGPPRLVWNGYVGGPTGAEYTVAKDGTGETVHVVTRATLCDRSVVAADRSVDPTSLELVAKPIPDPAADARKSAAPVKAAVVDHPAAALPLLRVAGASTGKGAAAADGDPTTAWNLEAGGGYDFVSFGAPPVVVASGFAVTFAAQPGARPPRSLLVVTDKQAFAVDVPEGAGPGSTIAVATTLSVKCIAVVAAAPDPRAKVATSGLAEVALTTPFDGKSLDDVAAGLANADSAARADVLQGAGQAGVAAAIRAYPALDGAAQELARRVVDASSCSDKLALYVPLLASKDTRESERAHERIEQCGDAAVDPLVAKIKEAAGDARSVYADELGLLAPDAAIPALVEGLAASDAPADRVVFRRALVKAAKRQRSVGAFDAALAPDEFDALSPTTRIDFLRGMGPRIAEAKRGPAAFESLWKSAAGDFRGKYLLLGPAAELAKTGDAFARGVLADAIAKDDDPRIRAHAAEVSAGTKDLGAPLIARIHDAEPRVRESSLRALAGVALGLDVERDLAAGLKTEPWTFVKRAAIAALADATDNAGVDAAMTDAMLVEEQPIVRSDIMSAFGSRVAKSQRGAIQDRAADEAEALGVRVAAVRALGDLCDPEALGDLTNFAQKGVSPGNESEADLAMAAIGALGHLHPSDLKDRLAPVLQDGVIADVRASARAALATTNTCTAR